MPDLKTNADVTFSESSGDLTARANRLNDGTDTATASEVRAFIDKEGVANGLATLDGDGELTETEFPSYVRKWFDTQAKIQAEIDRLGSTGGVLRLAPTEIEFTRAGEATGDSLTQGYGIRIGESDGPLSLVGEWGATKIKLADSQDAETIPILIRGTEATHRTAATLIQGIEINGNESNQVASWTDFGVLQVAYADGVLIDRVYIHDAPFMNAQVFRNSQHTTIQNSRFSVGPNATTLRLEAPYSLVTGCLFEGDGATTKALLDMSCNADIGVQGSDMVVQNNRFVDVYHKAISMAGVARCLVKGNVIHDVTSTSGIGIGLAHYDSATNDYDCEDNILEGNLMYNIRNGIDMTGNGTNGTVRTLILGNRMVEGPGISFAFGVRERSVDPNDYNVAYRNFVQGASTALSEYGTNSDIAAASNIVIA